MLSIDGKFLQGFTWVASTLPGYTWEAYTVVIVYMGGFYRGIHGIFIIIIMFSLTV